MASRTRLAASSLGLPERASWGSIGGHGGGGSSGHRGDGVGAPGAGPGYAGPHALLHAPEARTSSPVRVVRNKNDGQSVTAAGLFPAGEGAGYAGGIVSAAVDGMLAADFVVRQMNEALFLEER